MPRPGRPQDCPDFCDAPEYMPLSVAIPLALKAGGRICNHHAASMSTAVLHSTKSKAELKEFRADPKAYILSYRLGDVLKAQKAEKDKKAKTPLCGSCNVMPQYPGSETCKLCYGIPLKHAKIIADLEKKWWGFPENPPANYKPHRDRTPSPSPMGRRGRTRTRQS